MRKLETLNIKTIDHLCLHLGTSPRELERIQSNPSVYYSFSERMQRGKLRHFETPHGRLREILDRLQQLMQRLAFHESLQGGIKGRSIRSNVEPHIAKPVVLKLDIKDFFPSATNGMVYRAFFKELGCSPDVARCLTRLTTLHGHLPQGSPTSTIVSCIVLAPLVRRLSSLASAHGAQYTQYIDDITISGPAHLARLVPTIERIIMRNGFRANALKTQILTSDIEQVITGVRVNAGIDIPTEQIEGIKQTLQKLEKGELPLSDRGIASIEGKIHHIRQLNRGAGRFYRRKLNRILNESLKGPSRSLLIRAEH